MSTGSDYIHMPYKQRNMCGMYTNLIATFSLLLTAGLVVPQAEATNSSSNSTRPPYDDCMPFDPDKAMECARNFRVNDDNITEAMKRDVQLRYSYCLFLV